MQVVALRTRGSAPAGLRVDPAVGGCPAHAGIGPGPGWCRCRRGGLPHARGDRPQRDYPE